MNYAVDKKLTLIGKLEIEPEKIYLVPFVG